MRLGKALFLGFNPESLRYVWFQSKFLILEVWSVSISALSVLHITGAESLIVPAGTVGDRNCLLRLVGRPSPCQNSVNIH